MTEPAQMQTRPLGSTGVALSALSFGAAGIGNLYRPVTRDDAMATLAAAWDAGIRYFDTAPYYGQGLSERRLGDFLQDRPRADFVISTKVGRLLRPAPDGRAPDNGFVGALPFDVHYDYGHDGIMRSFEDSLARLGLPSVDILYVHDLEIGNHGEDVYRARLKTFLDSGYRALDDLKAAGVVRAIGLGVNEVAACIALLERVPLDGLLMAGRYSLLDRGAAPRLLDLCGAKGTAMVVGGVFNSGILATGARTGATFDYAEAPPEILARVAAMEDVAKAHDVALATAALQFPLRHPTVASVLIGTAKPASLIRNIECFGQDVPESLWPAMDALALPA
jgi:D-threo-aldose 1-dehydrogenase